MFLITIHKHFFSNLSTWDLRAVNMQPSAGLAQNALLKSVAVAASADVPGSAD